LSNKFRHPVNNVRFTRHLFFEETLADKTHVVYTLKDVDHQGYPSLYRLYMETDDPTEYLFATTHLDGWEHWQMLCECAWFKPYIARWRQELDLRTRAKYLKGVKLAAANGGKDSLAAMKYLIERGWEDKKTKTKIDKEAVKALADKETDTIAQQAERLGISIVK
jgi:hypothetical protein